MKPYIGKNATTGLVLASVALLASALLSYRNLQLISEKEELVVHTHEVIDVLNELFSTVKDAETGQRGFIITDDPDYLEPYERAAASIPPLFQRAELLMTDNAAQRERLADLKSAVDRRIQTLGQGVEQQRRGGFEDGRLFVLTGLGREQMLEIRRRVAEMIAAERELLAVRAADSKTIYATAVVTTILTTLVGLVLVGSVYFIAARELAARARTAHELERRVVERTAELNHLNQALQISNRELEQFASVASHDLQEPLRKIEAFGDRLKTRAGDALEEQSRDYLERILFSASRMRSLINDLLSFSRVTTKAQPPEPVDLQRTAQEVAGDLEGRLHQSNGRIEIGELPKIEADPLQMRQLLQNLIGNGLKFHRPGVPPVVAVNAEVAERNGSGPECILTVQDNGIGFEEVYLDRIFNVFQRLHGRNEYEGTGMGLAICRKIVERHGGTITAKSAPGEGARFIVSLPLQQKKDFAA